MLPTRLEDSTYFQYANMYKMLMQDEISPCGTTADYDIKVPGEEIKNAVGKVCAIKYDTPGIFHYHNSGGRFATYAIQIVSEGSLKYRVYVSVDGVNWDDKVKTILFDYVDEKFNVGVIQGGKVDKPVTDVFYYHVIGRLHMKIEVTDVKGKYYIIALD